MVILISCLCYNYGEMKLFKGAGFTIIETMLFLAISCLLFAAVLASTGNSVDVQRYHDSVYSLQTFLQKQLSDITNVDNDMATNDCGASTNVARGQSDCVILGSYITTADNGKTLIVKKVIGTDSSNYTIETDDINTFKQYDIHILQPSGNNQNVVADNYSLEWGAVLKNAKINGGDTSHFSIMMLRSPISGVIRTFIDDSSDNKDDAKIKLMLDGAYAAEPAKMCVDSGGLFSGPKSAVLVHASASSQSDIEVIGDKDSGC